MTRKQPTVPIHRETDETRRLILEAARRLFMKHGYRAVSTRQVADACGLTQPALYHHFMGKEGLYVAVLLAETGRLRGGLERLAQRDESATARLRQVAHYLLMSTDYDFALMQHDMRAELSPASRAVVSESFMVGVVAPLAGLVAVGQQVGELPDPLVGRLTVQAAALVFLSLVAHFLDSPADSAIVKPVRAEATAALVVDLLLHGLAGTPTAGSATN